MDKTKTVRMPAGIRNKLMAAVAMLLVSSIMMVSSTYAWFTLSTAPEVTGITTSVGANGNLEMALLNGQTFVTPADIKSTKSDSIAATGNVTVSNITWGNLVDLSDPAYGLNLIALNPAALNHPLIEGTTTYNTGLVYADSLLLTAVYGSDGRVAELKNNTITGVYDSTSGKWVGTQTFEGVTDPLPAYGVRAIGVDSSMTTAEIYLNEAKTNVNAWSSVASATASAVNTHKEVFGTIAMGGSKTKYTVTDIAALKDVATGVQSSLKSIVKVYSYAVLAAAASNKDVTEDVLVALYPQLINNTDAAALKELMGTVGVTAYTDRLTELETAQDKVAGILVHFDGVDEDSTDTDNEYTADTSGDVITANVVEPLIGDSENVYAFNADGEYVDISSSSDATKVVGGEVYVTGGLLGEVAKDAGPYYMTVYVADIYGGEATGNTGTSKDALIESTGDLAAVAAAVAAMDVESDDSTTTEKTIADFYGYILDFAFRTNASGSYLQLQTTPTNRVYSDATGENLATQGAGSTATFAFTEGMTEAQVTALLGAVNLVFLNPDSGTVHATAELTNINAATSPATADVKLIGQGEDNKAVIRDLPQNTATKLSVLVYLDGEEVDNGDVANAASSGMLNLNLQFSSSANLIPMQNTTLKNLVVTYTELGEGSDDIDKEYKAGLFTYNNVVYAVNDDYHIYKGNDGMTYFGQIVGDATEPTEYTKLTAVTMAEALSSLPVTLTGANVVKAGATETLTLGETITNAEIKSVTWASGDKNVATVAYDTTVGAVATTATVTGAAAGSTKITATVVLTFTYKETVNDVKTDVTYDKTVYVTHTMNVTAAETQTPAAGAYSVTISETENGTVTTDKTTANEGETVTLTVTPDTGYVIGTVSYPDVNNDGSSVTIGQTNGAYAFTMPAGDVTVNATFVDDTDTYRVTFNGNGDNASTNVTKAITSIDGSAPSVSRDNYTFVGWATTSNATAAETFTLSDGMTLYAVWQADTQSNENPEG